MSRNLLLQIVTVLKAHDNYFVQKKNDTGVLGLFAIQKIIPASRMLAYGVATDTTDEYIKIGEFTAIESTKQLCRVVIEIFGEQYLRLPNANDVARLLKVGEARGFLCMLGSLNCMHWRWKACPTGWAGQYVDCSGSPTIIFEVVADYDHWIWHGYFVLPWTNNDINVLEMSHLFANLTSGVALPAHYIIHGKEYEISYYLADSIYSKWSTLVQTIHDPHGPKLKLFTTKQESCRKDVERAFVVLQSKFAIVAKPARFWNKHVLKDIMTACIMHNMIVEDESDLEAPIQDYVESPTPEVEIVGDEDCRSQEFLLDTDKSEITTLIMHFEMP